MGAQKARNGRPTMLTDATEARVVAALAAGGSVRDAAAAAGVSARTVWSWLQRARSRDPADARHVAFERRVSRVLLARTGGTTAVMVTTPKVITPEAEEPAVEGWEMIAARLEAIAPERWALDWPRGADEPC
jgi:Homeodomain-like domain